MTRKRKKKRAPAHCAAGHPAPPRPGLPWPSGPAQTAVVVVVVVVAAALARAGMSVGAALELATGGLVLNARLRRERAW
ncbi:hypothetical protein ACIPLC_35310 [Kitasatospora sp. NPDC086801]|uniref:hypothetical protein n=1 Tax=Kitasatospora sp. NPDC086801 TaxID=3364066 RepID=UPI003803F8D2